jgi:hypothetical protein
MLIKFIFIFNILVFIGASGMAQKSFKSGINFGAKIGASTLLSEIPYDFSKTINEFNNKAGIAHSLEVSTYINPRWEIGFEWNFATLKGETNNPVFSAEGFQPGIPDEITEPAEYNNKINGPNIFTRYFFKPVNENVAFNPFIRMGIGILRYNSVFNYMETGEIIFSTKKIGTKMNTPVYSLGTGFKTSLSPRIYLLTSIDFNMVDYDFLDGIHNFDAQGNRQNLLGLYAEFKVGIFYNMALSKTKRGKTNKYSISGYMPFANL